MCFLSPNGKKKQQQQQALPSTSKRHFPFHWGAKSVDTKKYQGTNPVFVPVFPSSYCQHHSTPNGSYVSPQYAPAYGAHMVYPAIPVHPSHQAPRRDDQRVRFYTPSNSTSSIPFAPGYGTYIAPAYPLTPSAEITRHARPRKSKTKSKSKSRSRKTDQRPVLSSTTNYYDAHGASQFIEDTSLFSLYSYLTGSPIYCIPIQTYSPGLIHTPSLSYTKSIDHYLPLLPESIYNPIWFDDDTTSIELQPFLKTTNPSGDIPILWDVRKGVSTCRTRNGQYFGSLLESDLTEPACIPPVPQVKIIIPILNDEWLLNIKGTGRSAIGPECYVTVGDILHGVYNHLRIPLSPTELESFFVTDFGCRQVSHAFTQRAADIGSIELNGGIRRVDILAGVGNGFMWKGILIIYEGTTCVMELHFGSNP